MSRPNYLLVAFALAGSLLTGCSGPASTAPMCSRTKAPVFVIEAQTVPLASRLPCFSQLPTGWTFGGFIIKDGLFSYWLDSDRAGMHAAEVNLVSSCDVSSAVKVEAATTELPAVAFEQPTRLPPGFRSTRFLTFPGGCVQELFIFQGNAPATLALEVEGAVSLIDRTLIVDQVRADLGLNLCGADSPPCTG